MAEPLPESVQERTPSEPIDPTGEIARRNIRLALALAAIALLFAVGAVAVSLIYLHYD
jgi:hypothetical protein